MAHHKESVVLLIHCKDRRGIVARVSGFIHDFGGNILDSDHHTDEESSEFLMRMEFAAEVVDEARDPGHNPSAILAVNQEDDRFFLMGHCSL